MNKIRFDFEQSIYWYLTGIPELMAGAANRFEAFAKLPEVGHD
jgi:hypothetical protein